MAKTFVLFLLAYSAISLTAQQYSHGDPSNEEQLMLEMINRARANPTEEGIRLMDTDDPRVLSAYSFFNINKAATKQAFTTYAQKPPLAFHPSLITAAKGHSADMDANNFQGHNSSNGDDLGKRYSAVGYASQGTYGENVAAYSESVWHGHCGLNVDWGAQNQIDLGHRTNIMNIKGYLFTEIGIGILINDQGLQSGHVGPYVITQDFGFRSVRYITGVVYRDKNSNGFYDIGEGLAGVKIQPSRGSAFAVTSTSGGYAIPFSTPGSVSVTASEGGLAAPVVKSVDFNGDNVKLDFIPALSTPGAITLSAPANGAVAQPLTIALSWIVTPLADSYEWQIATTQTFTPASIVASGTSANGTASASVGKCNTKYYWRVRGVNGIGNGTWSSINTFTTGGKLPTSTTGTSPKGEQFVDSKEMIKFVWTASNDATSYHVRIKNTTAPFAVVYEDTACIGLSKEIPISSIGSGSFMWECRGKNTCGSGGWSTPVAFYLTITDVIESVENGWGMSVAPHPVSDNSVVVVTSPSDATITMTISDLTGASHVIGTYNITAGATSLPLSSAMPMASGVYVLRVEQSGVVVSRIRLVVSR
ncbi:MAG: CAP domain-containing protein [Candidatus Kapabacteria bacterium]|nr:CAP domain-containing protein [Candidatus Kapabacteria bacterium]